MDNSTITGLFTLAGGILGGAGTFIGTVWRDHLHRKHEDKMRREKWDRDDQLDLQRQRAEATLRLLPERKNAYAAFIRSAELFWATTDDEEAFRRYFQDCAESFYEIYVIAPEEVSTQADKLYRQVILPLYDTKRERVGIAKETMKEAFVGHLTAFRKLSRSDVARAYESTKMPNKRLESDAP